MAPRWIFFMECLLLFASLVIGANQIKNTSHEEDCYIFLPNGEKHDHFMFEVSTHNDLKRFNVTGNPGCQVRILAVGGGGYTMTGTGGGSGHVLFVNTSLTNESISIELDVGGERQASTINIDGVVSTVRFGHELILFCFIFAKYNQVT